MTPPALPDSPALTVPVKVYFYDTDAGGVVHNVAYLRMIEQARSELAEYLGWPLRDMTREACPVVARTEIDYLRPARLGDTLHIHARLTRLEKVKFVIEFEMRRAGDDTLVVRCCQEMVTVDLSSGRPRRLREDWRQRWPHLCV